MMNVQNSMSDIIYENIETVYKVALCNTQASSLAEDVTKEAFLLLFMSGINLEDKDEVKAFLVKNSFNLCQEKKDVEESVDEISRTILYLRYEKYTDKQIADILGLLKKKVKQSIRESTKLNVDFNKVFDEIKVSTSIIDEVIELVKEVKEENLSIDDHIIISHQEEEVELSTGMKRYKYATIVTVVFLLALLMIFIALRKEDNNILLDTGTPLSVSDILLHTPSFDNTRVENKQIYSADGVAIMVKTEIISTKPYVKLEFEVIRSRRDGESSVLTLWMSERAYRERPIDGIEVNGTCFLVTRGAYNEIDEVLKTKAPEAMEPINVWYLSNTGEWKEWDVSIDSYLLQNSLYATFDTITYTSFKTYVLNFFDSSDNLIGAIPFPFKEVEFTEELNQLLDTRRSQVPKFQETAELSIHPNLTLKQDLRGDFIHYHPQLSSFFHVEYYEKDSHGNNLMIVKRKSPHVLGLENLYLAVYDGNSWLVGKYLFLHSDKSDFKVLEYKGEKYVIVAGEIGEEDNVIDKFNIFTFKTYKWVDLINKELNLKAVLNEDTMDIFSEDTYLQTITYDDIFKSDFLKVYGIK